MKALLKSYGDVVGNAIVLVELKSELRDETERKIIFKDMFDSPFHHPHMHAIL